MEDGLQWKARKRQDKAVAVVGHYGELVQCVAGAVEVQQRGGDKLVYLGLGERTFSCASIEPLVDTPDQVPVGLRDLDFGVGSIP